MKKNYSPTTQLSIVKHDAQETRAPAEIFARWCTLTRQKVTRLVTINAGQDKTCMSTWNCIKFNTVCFSLPTIVRRVSMYQKCIKCVAHCGAQNSPHEFTGELQYFCNALHKINIFQPKLLILKHSLYNPKLWTWSTAPRPYTESYLRTKNSICCMVFKNFQEAYCSYESSGLGHRAGTGLMLYVQLDVVPLPEDGSTCSSKTCVNVKPQTYMVLNLWDQCVNNYPVFTDQF
jgi:hypothetical protein